MPPSKEPKAVEKFLPREFLFDLGVYLQTCAHIELFACALGVCLRGIEPQDEKWLQEFGKARKLGTSKLINFLKDSPPQQQGSKYQDDLDALCDWLHRFKNNRHIAVHGAFVETPNGFIRVNYLHASGSRKDPKYIHERAAVTKDLVEDILSDANRIFVVLLGFAEELRSGLVADIYRSTIPIVTHPSSTPI
jgi:hypothetical protein